MLARRRILAVLVAFMVLFAYGGIATAGLMSHYQFEGNAVDSVGGNNGTPVGSPTYTSGKSGQAVELNGSNQYFDTVSAGNMRLQGDFTVSAWINPDATDGDRTIFGTDQTGTNLGLHLVVRDNKAHLGFYGNDTPGFSTVPTNQWTHVAWQYDGQTQRIYVNGQLDASTGGHAAFDGNDTVKIGRWAGGRYFDGLLDEVSVFNHPLSAEQVELLAQGADPSAIGPLAPAGQLFALPTGPGGEWNVYSLETTTRTWDEARVYAANTSFSGTSGHLATMRDATENATIGIVGGGDRWIGLSDSDQTSTLDGTTLLGTEAGTDPNGGWAWVNGEPFSYQSFTSGEPNDSGGEDAAQLRSDGNWNDHKAGGTLGQADQRLPFIVEYDTLLATPPQLPGRGQVDPLTGQYYERVDAQLTWDEARVDAQNRVMGGVNGHLVSIANASENALVDSLGGDMWIGFHDSDQTSSIDGTNLGATEGTFQWVDGSPAAYTNWGGGEPNNSGNNEDVAHIRGDGMWNDHRAGSTLGQSPDQRLNSVVEYDLYMPYTASYLERKANTATFGTLDLAQAKVLLGLPSGHADIAAEGTADVYAISFQDPDAGGGRGEYFRRPFLTDTPGTDDQDFAVQVLGEIYIPETGEWTFAVSHDDHFELTVGPNTYASPGCCGNPTLVNGSNVFSFPAVGLYDLDLVWHERGGGAFLQLFAAQGNLGAFDPNVFALVGDIHNGGLALGVPEPSSFVLALFIGIAFLAVGWRRRSS